MQKNFEGRKNVQKSYYLLFAMLILVSISVVISFAYFSSNTESSGVVKFGMIRLDTSINVVESLTGVIPNDKICNGVSFNKLLNSEQCYVRVKVLYNTTDTELTAGNTLYLNILNAYGLDTTIGSDYKWSNNINGSYYLLNTDGTMKIVDDTATMDFIDEIYLPDLLGMGLTTIDTNFNNLAFNVYIQAIQTTNLSGTTTGAIVCDFSTAFSEDIPATYILGYQSNGGDIVTYDTVLSGQLYDLPTTTKEDYTFGGWFYEPALRNQFTTIDELYGNAVLFAKWTPAI